MLRDPIGYMGAGLAAELVVHFHDATELFQEIDVELRERMAGEHHTQLHSLSVFLRTRVHPDSAPSCIKRDLECGRLAVFSNPEAFDRRGGWGAYFVGLAQEDQLQIVSWFNQFIGEEDAPPSSSTESHDFHFLASHVPPRCDMMITD